MWTLSLCIPSQFSWFQSLSTVMSTEGIISREIGLSLWPYSLRVIFPNLLAIYQYLVTFSMIFWHLELSPHAVSINRAPQTRCQLCSFLKKNKSKLVIKKCCSSSRKNYHIIIALIQLSPYFLTCSSVAENIRYVLWCLREIMTYKLI